MNCMPPSWDAMRTELAGPRPSPIERLLVQRVVACWLQVYHADAMAAQAGPVYPWRGRLTTNAGRIGHTGGSCRPSDAGHGSSTGLAHPGCRQRDRYGGNEGSRAGPGVSPLAAARGDEQLIVLAKPGRPSTEGQAAGRLPLLALSHEYTLLAFFATPW